MSLTTGTVLGRYEVRELLGAGGMGEVYRGVDTRLNRAVAIKVLAPSGASDPLERARFEREAQVISSLNHPHICTLYDVGHQDGVDFLVMECLEGETLEHRLRRGPMSIDDSLRCAIDVADALDQAHRNGVIHRDLKPGNIMLTKSGVKLLDFGLAKTTDTRDGTLSADGVMAGTPRYMAPEQIECGPTDARTDIYALGAVLYEMRAGSPAFGGMEP